jgi:hypothetical protein
VIKWTASNIIADDSFACFDQFLHVEKLIWDGLFALVVGSGNAWMRREPGPIMMINKIVGIVVGFLP